MPLKQKLLSVSRIFLFLYVVSFFAFACGTESKTESVGAASGSATDPGSDLDATPAKAVAQSGEANPTVTKSLLCVTMAAGNAPATARGTNLATLSSDDTTSSITPLGTRYETAATIVPTATQLSFFADSSQNPPIPTSGDNSDLVYKAFDVQLYPSVCGLPSPIDLMQHALGNCDMVSAMAGLAFSHPSYIPTLIATQDNANFVVTLYRPDGSRLEVNVNNQFAASSDGTIAAVSGRDGTANWATVLEKAIEKYNLVYEVDLSGGLGQVGGMGSEHTLPMLTGDGTSYAFGRGVLSAQQLAQEVQYALDKGYVISGGFGEVAFVDGFQTVTAHGYTVLPAADENTMISMRNPWGLAVSEATGQYDASTDGVLSIAFDSNWAATIDLRIIANGAATTTPYVSPYDPNSAVAQASPVNADLVEMVRERRVRGQH